MSLRRTETNATSPCVCRTKQAFLFGPNPAPLPSNVLSGRGGFLLTEKKSHKPLKNLFLSPVKTYGEIKLCATVKSPTMQRKKKKRLVFLKRLQALKLVSSYIMQKGDFLLEDYYASTTIYKLKITRRPVSRVPWLAVSLYSLRDLNSIQLAALYQ